MEMKFIEDTLNEARYFSKEVRAYLYEIGTRRPLTKTEKKLWDATHDVHIHTNDATMMIQKNYEKTEDDLEEDLDF